ncbi:MAG: uroporphyrinogen decarboxylase family protein [Candidatus Aminicenantales bacterium]
MLPRELVFRTLEFRSPQRVPRQLWLLPWALNRYPREIAEIQTRFPDDIVIAPAFYRESLKTSGKEYEPGLFIDEWGCVFENRQEGVMGEVKEPLLKDWKDWPTVQVPRERLSVDRERVNAFCRSTDRFVLANTRVRPFEQLQFIRKSENLFLDLVDLPAELFCLLERIHAFYLEEMTLWAETEVDALVFSDDWGSQNALLISPSLWRKIFRPLYEDYVDIGHRHGKYVFMHSDGFIFDVLSDLVEIGVDALNAQLFCMNIEEIGENYAGRLTFWGEIDRQVLLPFGTRDEIVAAVKRVHHCLYRKGGVIAQCEFGVGAKPENVRAVFEVWENL